MKKTLYNKVDLKFKDVLSIFPEFRKKEDLLPMYVRYEFPDKQEYMVKFWGNVIPYVMRNYYNRIAVPANELREKFILDGFEPLGFYDVLNVLLQRHTLFDKEGLECPEIYQKLGLVYSKKIEKPSFLTSLGSKLNPFKISFFKKTEDTNLEHIVIVDYELFRKNILAILKKLEDFFKLRRILEGEELNDMIQRTFGFPEFDIRLYLDTFVTGKMLSREHIEIGNKPLTLITYNPGNKDLAVEKALLVLRANVAYFDERLKVLDHEIELATQEAKNYIKRELASNGKTSIKNLPQSQAYFRKILLLKKTIGDVSNKKVILEEQLISIESDSNTKEAIKLFQYAKEIHEGIQLDPDDLVDLNLDLKEREQQRKKADAIIEEMISDDTLEKEYKELEQTVIMEESGMAIEPTYKKENPIKKNIKEPAMTIEPEVDLSKSSIDREKLLQELM